jgi:hypothetical protein
VEDAISGLMHDRVTSELACPAGRAGRSIQRDLGVSQGSLQWVVIAYGLLLGGFVLVGGRMTDLLGRRRILLAGLGLFTAASLVAGAAQYSGVLIAARGLQGLGGALIAPAALSLLAVTFREGRERNRALGIFGAVAGAGGTVGVVASGYIAAGPGWRWEHLLGLCHAADQGAGQRLAAGQQGEDADGEVLVRDMELERFAARILAKDPAQRPTFAGKVWDVLKLINDRHLGAARACTTCKGEGSVVGEQRTYKVRIPAVIRAGQEVRIREPRGPGRHGGAPGDMYVCIFDC